MTLQILLFLQKKNTIEEAVDWIIEKTGGFLKYSYYEDAHFDYITRYPFMGKIIGKINPSVKQYLLGNDWH